MPDYIINTAGNLEDSHELIIRNVHAWLEEALAPRIPIIKDPGPLPEILSTGKSAVIEYDHDTQLWAHVRSTLGRYAIRHWATGDWRLPFKILDPSTLITTLLSDKGPELVNLPLLVVLAPEWPMAIQGMEHANYLLRQREGMRKTTFFCTRNLPAIVNRPDVTWYEKGSGGHSRPVVHPEFREFLVADTDVQHVMLSRANFPSEIKHLNGALKKDVL